MADHYVAAGHKPYAPEVRQSYHALAQEIKAQFEHALHSGVIFEPWGDKDPYKNSAEMREDVTKNRHLGFFQGGDMPQDHPLAQTDPDHGLTYNDELRAIHDLFGHASGGFDFGPKGEDAAWKEHRKMFSNGSLPSLTNETRMQNSVVNYGRHLRRKDGSIPKKGEEGYVPPSDRPFAPQHANIAPNWAMED
jgi:hypothetical protein